MTLLERAKQLEERARRQRTREERESIARKLHDRTRNLETLIARLEAARARASTLRETKYQASPWPEPPRAQFRAYDGKSASSRTNSAGDQAWEKFATAFRTFLEKAEKALGKDIAGARERALDGVSAPALAVYKADPSTQTTAVRLLNQLDLLVAPKWDAVSAPQLADLLNRASALRGDLVRMQESGSSRELLKFLALLRHSDGAPFAGMTPQLRDELEARNLLSRIRLVLR